MSSSISDFAFLLEKSQVLYHVWYRAQVVGWPPIRSFRKNSMATQPPKTTEDAEGKSGSGCLYVKVSMDGAPYLRKVDLKTYGSYVDLSSALEKMFSSFTIGMLFEASTPADLQCLNLAFKQGFCYVRSLWLKWIPKPGCIK